MKRTTRRHGAWARVTRAWLVAMMIGIFALTLAGPASAAAPPPGGGTTRPTVVTGGGTPPILQPTTPPVSSNPGIGFFSCDLYQRIKSVHVETGGREASLVIFDSQSTIATVQLSKTPPKKNASGFYYDAGDVTNFSLSPKDITHSVWFSALDPGATYYYLINAAKSTPTSDDAQKTGSFTMPKRYVTVKIDTITLLDDSDPFGPGELVFNLKVDGGTPAIYPDAGLIAFLNNGDSTVSWASGDTRTVDLQVTGVSNGQAVITLEGWDWDGDQPGWLNGQPINIDQNTVGLSGDKASTGTTIDVSGGDQGFAVSQSFTIQTTNQDLKFKASGTVSTTYAP